MAEAPKGPLRRRDIFAGKLSPAIDDGKQFLHASGLHFPTRQQRDSPLESPVSARLVFNVLAVGGITMFAGIMAHIGFSFGAYWQSLPPAAFLEWFAGYAPFVGRTIPVFVIIAFVGLAGSLWLDWNDARRRLLWLGVYACLIAISIITLSWHLPINSRLLVRSVTADQVPAILDTWLNLHWLRVAIAFLASILSIVAVVRDELPAKDSDTDDILRF